MPRNVHSSPISRSPHVAEEAPTSSASAPVAASAADPVARRSPNAVLDRLPQRSSQTPQARATRPPADRWTVAGAMADMKDLSSERRKRLLKKSASEQYLYAKSLTPEQRGQLEHALERDFSAADTSVKNAAATMWLSIQQARLRTHDDGHRSHHNVSQFNLAALSVPIPPLALGVRSDRRRYYSSPLRPEYQTAFDNFMRVIGDGRVSADVRGKVAQRLEYHWHSEGTIARQQREMLQRHGVQGLANRQYRASMDPAPVILKAQEREFVVRQGGHGVSAQAYVQSLEIELQRAEPGSANARDLGERLNAARTRATTEARFAAMAAADAAVRLRQATSDDIAQQQRPLGHEIGAWLKEAGAPPLPNAHAFDAEENARAFARVLARRMPSKLAQILAGGNHPALADGVMVIHAVAQDQKLRANVFELAIAALGSCGDNLAHGFSNIVLAVRNHQMMEDVKAGRIDQPELESRILPLVRHDMLEAEVHQFIAGQLADRKVPNRTRERLTNEPLETMLHAKVALKTALDLPDGGPSQMEHERVSVLTTGDLAKILANVQTKANDPVTVARWMLANSLWRTGMQHLHAAEFAAIESRFKKERDALRDLDPLSHDNEDFDAQHDFASQAREIDARERAAEDRLLLRRSGRDALIPAVLGVTAVEGGIAQRRHETA